MRDLQKSKVTFKKPQSSECPSERKAPPKPRPCPQIVLLGGRGGWGANTERQNRVISAIAIAIASNHCRPEFAVISGIS